MGRKTAACVLLFSFDRPELPVDTHVYRVASRLGLIRPKASFEEAHDVLRAATDPADVFELHVNLIRHGRRLCTARTPPARSARCWAVPLREARDRPARGERRSGRAARARAAPGVGERDHGLRDGVRSCASPPPPEDGKANEAVRRLIARRLRAGGRRGVAPSGTSRLRGRRRHFHSGIGEELAGTLEKRSAILDLDFLLVI